MGKSGAVFRWFGKKVFCFVFWREYIGQMGQRQSLGFVYYLMLLFAWTWRFVTVYICCDIFV